MVGSARVGLPRRATVGGGHQGTTRIDAGEHRARRRRRLHRQGEAFGVVSVLVGGGDGDVVDASVTCNRIERDRSGAVAVVDERRERRRDGQRGVAQRHDVAVGLRRGDRDLKRTADRHRDISD